MADTKETLMSNISKNVEEIKKSKFGTKLPSNPNKDIKNTIQELAYEQMIMGTLASLVWGQTNIKKEDQVKTLLGINKSKTIFGLVEDVNKALTNGGSIYKQIETYSETNKEALQTINENLGIIITNNTEALIRHLKENITKLGDKLNTEKFETLNKGIEELITKLSKNLAENFDIFVKDNFNPKFDELIKAVGKSVKNKESLKDSTTKILIDLKAADTIEQILEEFDALDGVVIFDNDNVNHVQDLLDRIDKLSKENIYLVIDTNLHDTVKELKELKIDIYDPKCLDSIKAEIDNLNNQKIEIFDTDNIDKARNLFEQLKKIKFEEGAENALTSLRSFLSAIEESKGLENISKDSNTLKKLTEFFKGGGKENGSITELINAIDNIQVTLDNEKFDTLSKAFSIVEIASKLMEGHDVKINKRFFKDLNTVLTDESYIKGLIKNLNTLCETTIKDNVRKNILVIDDFITAVSNLGNLGFIRLIKSKINIKLLRKFLLEDIKALIIDVDGFKSIRKDLSKSFESLDYLFDTISKLGDVNIKRKSKMIRNLIFIKEFLNNQLKTIIEEDIAKLASVSNENIESINAINTVIDSVLKFGEFDDDKIDKIIDSTNNLELYIEDDLASLLNSINKKLFKDANTENILSKIENVYEVIDSINNLNALLPSLISIGKYNLKLMLLNKEISIMSEILEKFKDFNIVLAKVILQLNQNGDIYTKLKEIMDIGQNHFKKIDNIIDFIKKLDALSKLAVISKLSNIGLKGISEEVDLIKTIINKFSSLDSKTIENAEKSLKLFIKLVVISAGILLLGSMIMKAVSILDLFAFTITLGTFLGAICFIFSKFKDGFKDAMKGAQDAALLVVAAGTILALGSLIISLIQPANLILFAFTLGAFLAGICYIFTEFLGDSLKKALDGAQDAALLVVAAGTILALGSLITAIVDFGAIGTFALMLGLFLAGICLIFNKLLGDSLKEALDGAQDAALLVVASGAILIYSGLISKIINPENLTWFTLILAGFIFAVTGTYALFSKMFKHAMKGAKEFGILIAFSGLTLILAGLLANKLDLGSLALFTLILGVFIFAVTGTYALFSKNFKRAMKGAKEFGLLIAISAAVLIIGTLVVQKWIDIPSLIKFTICLAGFIFAVVGVFGLASKFIKKSLATALAISLLTVICAGTLLLGAKFIQDNPGIIDSLLWFTGITIVYVAAMGVIMWLLGKIGFGALLKGILAIAAIGVITYGMVYVFNEAWNAFKDINWDKLITGFEKAGLVLAAVGVAITIIGGIMYATGGVGALVVAAGAAVMATLEALIWGIAKCMIAAANAIKSFEGINEEKVKAAIKPFGTFITEAADALTSLSIKQILKIKASVSSIQEMGKALSVIANSIQEFANLKIPVYDKNGKISGYLNFNQEWLGLATENIKEIILCIGTAIIDTYKHAQETGVGDIFDAGWFSKDTPFSRVAKSMKNVGPMLSSIADAIQDWAYLRVPVYDSRTGKQTGYKQLKDTELTNAASNIQSVLITIGAAIIGTYKFTQGDTDLKDIFEPSGWFGSSPFAKVTKAMKTMGPMLESIADGIQSWADLKVPVYDSNGKVKGYKQLKDTELTTAGNNIRDVLVAIGNALVTTVKGNTEIFGGDDMIHNSPAVSAAKAMKIIGETLNLTAQTIGYYAKGKFPVFDKNGKKIDEYTVDNTELILAGIKIEQILTCIGRSILNIFKDPKNKELFQGTSSNSPALMAAKSVNEMSKALNASIAAIKQLSELKLDDLHKALNPNCETHDNIYWRIQDLLKFTIEIYKLFAKPNGEEYGSSGLIFGHDQNFAEFLNEHNPEIKDAGQSIEDFSNLLNIIINNFAKMGKTFEKSLKDIVIFSIIVSYISTAMKSIGSIINILTSETALQKFENAIDKKNELINGENSTFAVLDNLLRHMINTKKLFEQIQDFELTNVISMINSFDSCVQALSKIGKQGEENVGNIKLSLPSIDAAMLGAQIAMYTTALDMIIKVNEHAKEAGEEGYNVLKDGILKIYGATQQIENTEIFGQHVKELKDYVEAINSIKLNHLGGLKGLVDSMNELSQRLGNLDNLTDAIGNKLSQVLYELVLQLRKAEATIHNAHELQEKRKKLMDESIEKIHSIMDHHMIVEISQQKEEDKSNTPPGKIGGNPIDDKSPQGTDPTPPTSTASKANPEETTAAQGTDKSRVSNQPDAAQLKDVLTFGKFKDYMEKQYLNKIRNSG